MEGWTRAEGKRINWHYIYMKGTSPFLQATPQSHTLHATSTHASEGKGGEFGEAERSTGAELPGFLASGPELPHAEGEVLETSVRAKGK